MLSWRSVAVWTVGMLASAPACAKKKEKTSALDEATAVEVQDAAPKAFFSDCTERAEMKAGNHYKVYDCGAQRSSYYDSPGLMTFEEVTAPISAEARSLGYQVFPSEGSMHIQTHVPDASESGSGSGASGPMALDVTLPVKFLTHKTPPALGGETKFTVVVILQPLEGERTRVHDCRIPAGDAAVHEAGIAWCNQAFDETFSYEKSAEDSLMEMKRAEFEEANKPPPDPSKPTTVIIGDQK